MSLQEKKQIVSNYLCDNIDKLELDEVEEINKILFFENKLEKEIERNNKRIDIFIQKLNSKV